MPKQKEKSKKKVESDSESEEDQEVSEKDSNSAEEVDDDDDEVSEGSDDDKEDDDDDDDKSSGKKKKDDDDDDDESEGSDDKDGSEKESDKEGGSDDEKGSDDSEEKSEKSKKSSSSKEDSDDDTSKSESEDSEDDSPKGKKKKQKVKSKEKGKSEKKNKEEKDKKAKDKKGGKEEKPLQTPTPNRFGESSKPSFTIASISNELDELSEYLSKTFRSFRTAPSDRLATFNPYNQKEQYENENKESSHKIVEKEHKIRDKLVPNASKNYEKAYSMPLYDHDQGFRNSKPLKGETGVQNEPVIERKQASPEAKRAVEEYKRRKELEKKGLKDESVGSIHDLVETLKESSNTKRSNAKERAEDQEGYRRHQKEENKGESEQYVEFKRRNYSPNKSGGSWSKSNQIAENYYSNVSKKLIREPSPSKKTLNDLYRHKPKSKGYLEDESQPIVQSNESWKDKRHEQRFQQNDQLKKYQSVLDANRRQINNALDILVKKSKA